MMFYHPTHLTRYPHRRGLLLKGRYISVAYIAKNGEGGNPHRTFPRTRALRFRREYKVYGKDPFGRVLSGKLVVTGLTLLLKGSRVGEEVWTKFDNGSDPYEEYGRLGFLMIFDNVDQNFTTRALCLLLGTTGIVRFDPVSGNNELVSDTGGNIAVGLTLVYAKDLMLRRIGTFQRRKYSDSNEETRLAKQWTVKTITLVNIF